MWRPGFEWEATVPALLHYAVAQWGDRDLVVTETERMSYADVEVASRRLAKRLLAAGAGKGTRIGTRFPYGTQWIVSWLAVERIGALHMPFSTAYKPAELRKTLRLGDVALLLSPRWLFGDDQEDFLAEALGGPEPDCRLPLRRVDMPYLREVWFDEASDAEWARPVVVVDPRPGEADDDLGVTDGFLAAVESQVSPADLAITIFTSGTTSAPKAICHSQGALVRKGAHLATLQAWQADDRIFCGMPFFWVGGVAMTVVPAMSVGAAMLCIDRTEPVRALDLMERESATKLTGWPGVIGPITTHPTAAERGIPALARPVSLVGARHSSLGMTETLASYTYSTPEDQQRPLPVGRTGSMGWPIEGAEIRIVDPDTYDSLPDGTEGAILVRGYFVMQSRYKFEREEEFTSDGFYDTGDKGYLLDGILFLTGRTSEVIKTFGNNVSPPEVEAVLRSFPEVKDVHVLGVPDAERGEVVAALVVPMPGTAVDPVELRERSRRELSNFKVPRYVVLAADSQVPMLATGKPDRLRIRAMLAASKPEGR
jgi:acyl-CoA synthetase (AMP-forming)/AMP-acid ligase II